MAFIDVLVGALKKEKALVWAFSGHSDNHKFSHLLLRYDIVPFAEHDTGRSVAWQLSSCQTQDNTRLVLSVTPLGCVASVKCWW